MSKSYQRTHREAVAPFAGRRFFSFLAIFLLIGVRSLFAQATSPAAQSGAKFIFWKAASPTATVYLLGSLHMATPDMYPLPKEVEDAYKQAKILAVEFDITKMKQEDTLALLQEKGMFTGEDTLNNHLPADMCAALAAYCDKHEVPPPLLEKFRPWTACIMLSFLEFQRLGFDESLGVDHHFLDHDAGKTILELESANFQMNLLSGFSEKLQVEWLKATLKQLADFKDHAAKLKTAWLAGDAKTIVDMEVESDRDSPELKEIAAKLIDDRNVGMAKKIETILAGNQTGFVVVGALHLVGKKGVVQILTDHGFHVEQATVTPAAKPIMQPAATH